ncbi:hypothetical protein BDZ89DRAFT_511342 [Hymenopellis radicata]|nr:hypothetical protein BDZ89DRAFT_511342 [Hymenopellis radicata]
MSTSLATAQHFARCLAEVIGGHPLVDGTPPPPYVNFLKEGTQLFDVCYIDNEDGRLRYVFSSAHDRGGERNQDNAGHTISPPRHKKYTGATNDDDWDDQAFHESHCYRSQTIDERSVSAEASIPLPHGVLPQLLSSMSASFSTSSRDAAGALLYLPRPHTVFKDKRVNLSSSYAKKNTKSWYEHVNKTQRRGVRNGELYFITGCHKTKEWHSLCMYSTQRSRDISINFHPIPEAGITFTGRFFHAAEGMESKKGGVTREDESDTQCVAVRGWKLYLCNRFWRRAKVPVRVNKAGDWKSSDWVPCKSEEPEAPSSGFNAPLLSTSKGLPRPLGLSSRDTDIIDDVESVLLKQRDDEYRVETEKVIAESDDSSWIDSSCNAGSTSVEESHSSHPLTTVFPYLEESAPWMEAAIAHDMQYLALLKKGEYVPETKELVARLFERFVIEVDEGM